jgi:hypothetical protein
LATVFGEITSCSAISLADSPRAARLSTGQAVGNAAGGVLVDRAGPAPAFAILPAAATLAALVTVSALRPRDVDDHR